MLKFFKLKNDNPGNSEYWLSCDSERVSCEYVVRGMWYVVVKILFTAKSYVKPVSN